MSLSVLSDLQYFTSQFLKDLRSPSDFFRRFGMPKGDSKRLINNNCKYFSSNYILVLLVCALLSVLKFPLVFIFTAIAFATFLFVDSSSKSHVFCIGSFRVEPQHLVLVASLVLSVFVPNKIKAVITTLKWMGFGAFLCLCHSIFYKPDLRRKMTDLRDGIID
ncbi:hypothetical protein GEMRC1_004882 [Eukaryota sp. GEM-RC1]